MQLLKFTGKVDGKTKQAVGYGSAFLGAKVRRARSTPESFEVLLTEDAAGDLNEIYGYIENHDAPSKADHVLDRIQEVLESLRTFPERGAFPRELLALGIREYRQTYFKPYRLIYRVIGRRVYVYLIADGRRDMQALLERRLLGA